MQRDLVAIGCSAGGVEALPRVLQQLPADFPAAVVIVQHLGNAGPTQLADLLARRTAMPVSWAEQGAPVLPGHVYVAPPDVHLLVADGHIRLTRSARENHARPSIDALFRAVAASYASRAIGVLLTGMLEDGVAGLRAIRDAGGEVIVQDPSDAEHPELPSCAVLALDPDRVLPLDAIGVALTALTGRPTAPVPLDARCDRALAPRGASPGEVDSALWSAVRALRDRVSTLETLARDARRVGSGLAFADYDRRAREANNDAELARSFMVARARTRADV